MKLINIKSPKDIKNLSIDELKDLASQMRSAIVNYTSTIGGHVGPNLGDVEALIALHYVFDAPKDKLVIDVSHQDFVHKMLTGRAKYYLEKDKFRDIGEFTDPKESPEYDLFYAGHTSPSISLSFGLAKARALKKQSCNIVAFIGDGSLSGGVAFEGLDAAGKLNSNFIVIVNDNQMAIAENHGSLYDNLQELRETNGQSSNNFFKTLGYDYVYVRDGNNLEALIKAYKKVKDSHKPVVVHINTQKGLGYKPAEALREEFHFSAPYDVADGEPLVQSNSPDYITVTRDYLLQKVKEDPTLLIISSATPEVFGFMEKERKECGEQYIDVAIAEQTGVSTMAGAARAGAKVIYPVAATFLQRAYDQLEQDWAMNDSPAVMPVLHTGIRGLTDLTHLGFWDIPMIASIPNIVYLAPTNAEEYKAMMDWALSKNQHKVAIRVPTYSFELADGSVDTDYSDLNKFKVVRSGKDVALIAAGDFFVKGRQIADELAKKGIQATLINPRFVSGVDEELILSLEKDHKLIVTLEDGSIEGGFGGRVAQTAAPTSMRCLTYGLKKEFVDRYNPDELEEKYGLTVPQIVSDIENILK